MRNKAMAFAAAAMVMAPIGTAIALPVMVDAGNPAELGYSKGSRPAAKARCARTKKEAARTGRRLCPGYAAASQRRAPAAPVETASETASANAYVPPAATYAPPPPPPPPPPAGAYVPAEGVAGGAAAGGVGAGAAAGAGVGTGLGVAGTVLAVAAAAGLTYLVVDEISNDDDDDISPN